MLNVKHCLFITENVPDEVVHRVKRIVNGESVEPGGVGVAGPFRGEG